MWGFQSSLDIFFYPSTDWNCRCNIWSKAWIQISYVDISVCQICNLHMDSYGNTYSGSCFDERETLQYVEYLNT